MDSTKVVICRSKMSYLASVSIVNSFWLWKFDFQWPLIEKLQEKKICIIIMTSSCYMNGFTCPWYDHYTMFTLLVLHTDVTMRTVVAYIEIIIMKHKKKFPRISLRTKKNFKVCISTGVLVRGWLHVGSEFKIIARRCLMNIYLQNTQEMNTNELHDLIQT